LTNTITIPTTLIINIFLLIKILRTSDSDSDSNYELEDTIREEFTRNRNELVNNLSYNRTENTSQFNSLQESLLNRMNAIKSTQRTNFEGFSREQRQKFTDFIITGPTTIAAFLNSLQMGFRTLAIQKRTSEVWEVLGAVKHEFGKFSDILEKTKKKLTEATNVIEDAQTRTRVMGRKLKNVVALPEEEPLEALESGILEDVEKGADV
jgi:DNA anti-recombination protein RmuC